MNTAILYRSVSGHNKKIAEAIANELKINAYDVKYNPELQNVDLLFIAGGIYAGQGSNKLINFAKALSSGAVKKAVIITSSASGQKRQEKLREVLSLNNIYVPEKEYTCRGAFLFAAMGRPGVEDIAGAIKFAQEIIAGE